MNRTIALFLALAVLLAHALALHKSPNGDVGPPYDQAHVAYRLGRNLAQTGSIRWEINEPPVEGHPSLFLIGLASIAEQGYVSVTTFCQTLGAIATFLAVIVVSFFSPVRLAGVIAPLLLVVSGGLAASALSGTEIPFAALFLTASFYAFEHRRPILFALCLPFLCTVRPEGVPIALAFLACELSGSKLARPRPRNGRPPRMLTSFLPAAAVMAVVVTLRYVESGVLLSPSMRETVALDELGRGGRFVADFVRGSVTPLLAAFPLWYVARRTLLGTGARALLFTALWALAVAAGGGGSMPFTGEMVPVLPILCVSVQEAMQLALDSKRRGLPQLSWTLFLLGMFGSALASKFPGDLGPIPTEELHRRWLEPYAEPRHGYGSGLSRLALSEELRTTERLRAAGLFLRDQVAPDSTLLTPWPGAVGYLSHLRVLDLLGRTTPSPGRDRVRAWSGRPRADVLAALELRPDYVMPSLKVFTKTPHVLALASEWLSGLDTGPTGPWRLQRLVEAFGRYEMLAVPLQYGEALLAPDALVLYVLRRRALDLAPKLSIVLEDEHFRVEVRHRSHGQVVDLSVQLEDPDGNVYALRPTGQFVDEESVLTRTGLFLPDTGNRSIRLVRAELPPPGRATVLRAVLRNPGARGDHSFANASEVVQVDL